MVYKRKKYHYGDTHLKKQWRTKRRKRDLDEVNNNVNISRLCKIMKTCYFQIDEDLKETNAEKLLNQETDVDKPGQAQFYCIHCARYFINDHALQDHFRTKVRGQVLLYYSLYNIKLSKLTKLYLQVHKRRMKALELEPYSIEDSERAAGQGNFKLPQKRKITTQPTKEELEKDPLVVKKLKLESM